MFKNTLLAKICFEIEDNIAKINASPKDIDTYSKKLIVTVIKTISKHVFKATSSPYAK